MSATPPAFTVVLTGNPNCGKTTLFNALTGLRAKVGNYAGVTVERKEGAMLGSHPDRPIQILDLPGTYSLSPQSLDEQIARDVLFQRLSEVPAPGLVVVVVDASNLQRNLYYATQVIELGHPTLIALNMMDVARANGHELDLAALSIALGVPVLPLVASDGDGVNALQDFLRQFASKPPTPPSAAPKSFLELPEALGLEARNLALLFAQSFPDRQRLAAPEAVLVLCDDKVLGVNTAQYPSAIQTAVQSARARLEALGIDWRSVAIEARYARVFAIQQHVTTETAPPGETFSDKLDRILTHKIWGLILFVAIMGFMFQAIFSVASYPMDAIEVGVDWLASSVGALMGPGDLQDLLANGVVKGVGAVIVFLPQICLLFLFISLLEDTGYMARAAFLMDRFMSRVGLHGKSFIPMLSSFACAIPGIMATRTIETPKDRLATILVAPLISCSARLPVYTILIAACIPQKRWLGIFGLPGLTLLAMYLAGIVAALGMAWLFKKTLLRGEAPMLILELPPYKRPVLKVVLRHMWDRSKMFLQRAGTVILGINILLWFLATYPRDPEISQNFDRQRAQLVESAFPDLNAPSDIAAKLVEIRALNRETLATNRSSEALVHPKILELDHAQEGEELRRSFAGMVGHWIEPVVKPLGFDWKIGVGIVASFAAREVFVSTMSVVYNVGKFDDSDEATSSLTRVLQAEKRPDGSPMYSPLTGLSLMLFYVFALQCVSTVAVTRRETNGWKWPLFQWAYMTGLGWFTAFVFYQAGRWLGFS